MMDTISTSDEEGGFLVDIGEKDLFKVGFHEIEKYTIIHQSYNSVLVKCDTEGYSPILIRVVWSKFKRPTQSKGYMGMQLCSSHRYVPTLHSSEVFKVCDTYVGVICRDYIEGKSLLEAWGEISDDGKKCIIEEISEFVSFMNEKTSTRFMRLQGKGLSTKSPITFMDRRIVVSTMCDELDNTEMRTGRIRDFNAVPILNHSRLTKDHIIVNNGHVVGIVGWSSCDFLPSIFSSMQYIFMPVSEVADNDWLINMSNMSFTPGYPIEYTEKCAEYFYSRSKKLYEQDIERFSILYGIIMTGCSKERRAKCESDQWSRRPHKKVNNDSLGDDSSSSFDWSLTSDGGETVREILDYLSTA